MNESDPWAREKATWPNHELSRFVDAGGIRWHIQEAGAGPAMLLIHGTGASTHSWRDLLPLLSRDYRVLAIDLPGHGFTEPLAESRISIAGMSEAVGSLLRVLHFDPLYGVGHSAGAVILCRLALDRRIAPYVLISINGAFLPLAGAAGVLFAPIARLLSKGSLLPKLIASRVGNRASVARVIAGTGSRLDPAGLDLYVRLVRNPKHVAGALAMMSHWDLYAFERELPKIAAPLALVVGENDRTVPPNQALTVQRRVARATLYPLPGLGHLAHEEQPEIGGARNLEDLRGIPLLIDSAHAPRTRHCHRQRIRRPRRRGAPGCAGISRDRSGTTRRSRAAAPMSFARTASSSMRVRPSSPRRSCSRICGGYAAAGFEDDVQLRAVHPFYRIRFHDGEILDCSNDDAAMARQIGEFAPGDVAGYRDS